jgi:hypothetical protein
MKARSRNNSGCCNCMVFAPFFGWLAASLAN